MKEKIIIVLFIMKISSCFSQSNIDLSTVLDTVYLREFEIDSNNNNSLELLRKIDTILQRKSWMGYLDDDEGYFIDITKYPIVTDLARQIPGAEFVAVSKRKRINTLLLYNVIGFFIYKKKCFFLTLDDSKTDYFIPTVHQKEFLFYDMNKIYKLDLSFYFDLMSFIDALQFEISNNRWTLITGDL
ncbi:MAG: hypothetical protein ACPGSD_09135 [Flavobacteriales bacterium]